MLFNKLGKQKIFNNYANVWFCGTIQEVDYSKGFFLYFYGPFPYQPNLVFGKELIST